MKQNPNFIVSEVAGNHVLIPVGKMAADFNGIVSLNDMGLVIWELLQEETDPEQILAAVLREYAVAPEQAKKDIEAFLMVLKQNGCIEE